MIISHYPLVILFIAAADALIASFAYDTYAFIRNTGSVNNACPSSEENNRVIDLEQGEMTGLKKFFFVFKFKSVNTRNKLGSYKCQLKCFSVLLFIATLIIRLCLYIRRYDVENTYVWIMLIANFSNLFTFAVNQKILTKICYFSYSLVTLSCLYMPIYVVFGRFDAPRLILSIVVLIQFYISWCFYCYMMELTENDSEALPTFVCAPGTDFENINTATINPLCNSGTATGYSAMNR